MRDNYTNIHGRFKFYSYRIQDTINDFVNMVNWMASKVHLKHKTDLKKIKRAIYKGFGFSEWWVCTFFETNLNQ